MSATRNRALMESGRVFHDRNDDLASAPFAGSSIEYTRVVGDSRATVEAFRKVLDTDCVVRPETSDCKNNYETVYSNPDGTVGRVNGGDGTIPVHSADLFNLGTFDLRRGILNFYAHNVEHGALARDETVLNFAISYFAEPPEEAQQPAQANSSTDFFSIRVANAAETAQAESGDKLTRLAETNGLSTTPEPFGGMELATSGPVSGYIEDGAGNVLGSTPDTTNDLVTGTIPGGDYNSIGDRQSFFLNDAAGSYEARLVTNGKENVELKVRIYEEGQVGGRPTTVSVRLWARN